MLIKFLLKLQNDNYTSLNRGNEAENKAIIKQINKAINDIENYDLDDIYGPIPINKFIILFTTITFIMFLTQIVYT